jgi:hypothetical protein
MNLRGQKSFRPFGQQHVALSLSARQMFEDQEGHQTSIASETRLLDRL